MNAWPRGAEEPLERELRNGTLDGPTWEEQVESDTRRIEWRERVALELEGRGYGKQAERFRDCGAERPLLCGNCGSKRWGAIRCEVAICPDCARKHAARTRQAWRSAAKRMQPRDGYRWVMLTLTIESSGNIRSDYDKLRAAWRSFRLRLQRRYPGIGGFAAIEVGASRNVHLHTLCLMPYVPRICSACEAPQARTLRRGQPSACCGAELHCGLSPMWREASGAPVCDLRAAYGGAKADPFLEACKYITKLDGRAPFELVEIWASLRRATLQRAWGAAFKLVGKIEVPRVACKDCGSTHWITFEGLAFLEAHPPPN